ncbi:MAG: mechanosensitive ion channel [Luteitalea sp.]|nr:mechanosensitive ion channel [Luteitalea sp.]
MTPLASQIFEGLPPWTAVPLGLGLAFVVAYAIAELAARAVRFALTRVLGSQQDAAGLTSLLRPARLVRIVVFVIVGAALAAPAIGLVGVETGNVGLAPEGLLNWLVVSGLRILLIGLLAYVIIRIVGLVVARLEEGMRDATTLDMLERAKRARTIGNLLRNVVVVIVSVVAVLMVLAQLDINIMPALAAAGVVSLAIGFGAQTLVKDIIAGFFLILENQVRVGDVAAINGTGGVVEALTLRTIVLRDLAGTVHVFPNGSINTLSNMTKDFSYAVFDIGVAYKEDPDAVIRVIKEVGEELLQDLAVAPKILAPIEVFGIDAFGPSEILIKARIKTLPLRQWDVAREFRRRLKKAFDAQGIEIPFPQRTLHFGDATRLLTELQRQTRKSAVDTEQG